MVMAQPPRSPQWYEAQYNNRAMVPEHPQIFVRWKESSQRARDQLGGDLDVAFGEHPLQRLDVFRGKGKSQALLLFIHGGYWRSLDKSDFSFIAPPLVERGITVALNNYRLCPFVSLEDLVHDNLAACAWLWRHARHVGADPDRIFVCGHSAGGHLTTMMMAALWPSYAPDLPATLVKGGLAISGLYDLSPLIHTNVNNDLHLTPERAERCSPAFMPPPAGALLYTAVGGQESDEFKRQNRLIGEKWRAVFKKDAPALDCNHFTVVEQLAQPDTPLFAAALKLIQA
jgi:arylformamidase